MNSEVKIIKQQKRIEHLEETLTKAIDFLYGKFDKSGFYCKFDLARELVRQRDYNKNIRKQKIVSHENRSVNELIKDRF